MADSEFFSETKVSIESTLQLASKWMDSGNSANNGKFLSEIRMRMSESGGIIRGKKKVEASLVEAADLLNQLPDKIGSGSVTELADSFLLMDHCITHFVYLETIKAYIEKGGRSRGSYIIADMSRQGGPIASESVWRPELCTYDRDIENKIIEVGFRNGSVRINLAEVREIPVQDLWFEKVWKEYIEDIYFNC